MKYILEVRSQKSVGSSGGGFGGPDTYVAVQCVPEGVTPLIALNERNAQLRQITIRYFGQGYSRNTGPKSALGRALAAAQQFIAEQEAK